MTALKGQDVERFIASPDPKRPFAFLYGPDAGLVAERARAIASKSVDRLDDPFAVTRLDGDVLASDPARLADEVGTIAMFGGRRLVWIRAGDKPFVAALEAALSVPMRDVVVVIEAGDLKPRSPLRALAEKDARIAALPCYADTEDTIRRIIVQRVQSQNSVIEPDALALAVQLLGADRAATRAEIDKLCLYAGEGGRIGVADVAAVVGDAAVLALDPIIDAAFGGDPATLDRLLARAHQSDLAVPAIIAAALRHAMALHRARVGLDGGMSADTAIERFEGGAHFRRKPALSRQLSTWSLARLERAIQRLSDAALESRVRSSMADVTLNRTLMAIALMARGPR